MPGLTFGNAVLCLKVRSAGEAGNKLESCLTLGAHDKTTNEAVQGDMCWASVE